MLIRFKTVNIDVESLALSDCNNHTSFLLNLQSNLKNILPTCVHCCLHTFNNNWYLLTRGSLSAYTLDPMPRAECSSECVVVIPTYTYTYIPFCSLSLFIHCTIVPCVLFIPSVQFFFFFSFNPIRYSLKVITRFSPIPFLLYISKASVNQRVRTHRLTPSNALFDQLLDECSDIDLIDAFARVMQVFFLWNCHMSNWQEASRKCKSTMQLGLSRYLS